MCLQQPRTDAFVHHLGAAVGVGGDLGAGEMAVKAVFLADPRRTHRLDAIGETGKRDTAGELLGVGGRHDGIFLAVDEMPCMSDEAAERL